MNDLPFPSLETIADAVAQEFFISRTSLRADRTRYAALPRRAFMILAQSMTPYGQASLASFLGVTMNVAGDLAREAQAEYETSAPFRRRLLAIQAEILSPDQNAALDALALAETLEGDQLRAQLEPETIAALGERATLAAACKVIARYAGQVADPARSVRAMRLGANLAALARRIERDEFLKSQMPATAAPADPQ